MSTTLTRTQIYIETDVLNNAKIVSKKLNITLSEFIRTAVKQKTQELEIPYKKPIIKPITINSGLPTNIATTHNDIYDN